MRNEAFIYRLTLVAALGGLLFGYDTAVISGAVGSLKEFFTGALRNDATAAANVVGEYKALAAICFVIIDLLIINFLFRLFDKSKAIIYSLLVTAIVAVVIYNRFMSGTNELTEDVLNSINGFTISSALLGCIIGGSIAGYISERIGRRNGLVIAAVLFLLSAIGSAIPDYLNIFGLEVISSFIIFRVVGGIGVGVASMISPMYIAEIAPASIRGKLVSWNQFAIIFGINVVYFVNYFIAKGQPQEWIDTVGWRWMFASEVIPATLFAVLLFTVPKTPRYLVLINKPEEAGKILSKVSIDEREAQSTLAAIRESLKQKHAPWLFFGSKVIIIGILLSAFQQFVGINVVLYYAPEIFKNMGSNTDASLLQTIIVGSILLVFTVVAIFTVDKYGRKPLQILGAIGMAFSMFLLGTLFYFDQLGLWALFAMLFYVASFAYSWGPVVWVQLSEIFPNRIKGALAMAVAAQWISNLIVSWTFPLLNDSTSLTEKFNHGFAYWIYGFFGVLAAWFMWKFVPETKGRSLETMEELWAEDKKGVTVS